MYFTILSQFLPHCTISKSAHFQEEQQVCYVLDRLHAQAVKNENEEKYHKYTKVRFMT